MKIVLDLPPPPPLEFHETDAHLDSTEVMPQHSKIISHTLATIIADLFCDFPLHLNSLVGIIAKSAQALTLCIEGNKNARNKRVL